LKIWIQIGLLLVALLLDSFVLSIIAFSSAYTDFSRNLPEDIFYTKIALGIAIVLILFGLYLIRLLKRKTITIFVIAYQEIFLLPKRFGCPAYSMPFSELSLHTVHLPS